MTKENLITGPANISKADAHDLLAKFKIESCRSSIPKAT